MHHIDCYFLFFFFFGANLQSTLVFCFFFFLSLYVSFVSVLLILSIMSRKTRANRKSSSSSVPTFDSERFLSEKNQETYEKLNICRNVWAERKVVLDELDGEIRRNFERRGWLPLLDISDPPSAALIREFHSNLLFTPMILTLWWEVGYEWRVHHYSFGSDWCSWGATSPASCLSLRWVSTPWWHYVISYSNFYPVWFWSSDHFSQVDRDSLSFLPDFLPFHLAYLSPAHYSFGEMCIFVCACHEHFYEFSLSFHTFFDWGS